MSATTGTVLIMGAGTMGAGIAQVAATRGWTAKLLDVDVERTEAAIAGIGKRIDRLVEKGRLSSEDAAAARARLIVADGPDAAVDCDLLLEAIVERMDVKVQAVGALLEHASGEAIVATNTSSLSVTELGRELDVTNRIVGMHFFNPAPLMKLVEVIPGASTDDAVVRRTREIAESWGKVVAIAKDAPGFIVNHVARPYYLEAFRVLDDGIADVATIDSVMRKSGRFRMGPLELTDLIGQDVNTATTRSVWERLDQPPLLAPSPLQESLVAKGDLGRKTGRGVYDHAAEPAIPHLVPDARPAIIEDDLAEAAIGFACAASDAVEGEPTDDPRAALALARILLALFTQGQRAADLGIGSPGDIDTALRYGTNYPLGPIEWATAIGPERLDAVRTRLSAERFAAAT